MKVLLFVQNGDARPKCEGVLGPLGEVPWQRKPAALLTALGEYGVSLAQQQAVESADRWWLVECHNAEEGRELIYLRQAITAAHRYMGSKNPEQGTAAVCGSVPAGRILASGGKAVA